MAKKKIQIRRNREGGLLDGEGSKCKVLMSTGMSYLLGIVMWQYVQGVLPTQDAHPGFDIQTFIGISLCRHDLLNHHPCG